VKRLLVAFCVVAAGAPLAPVVAGASAASPAPQDTSSCPPYNPPNGLALVGGTPQSAKLGAPFESNLQVALVNTNGCPITTPIAGIAVTFAAPGSGPSGTFSSSGSNAVLVGTNASGTAMASQFTANRLPGGYAVVATSDYGSVAFSLVNTASGVPATIVPLSPPGQSATVSTSYAHPLQVKVADATGAPVAGVDVAFSLASAAGGSGGGDGSGGGAPGASFDGGENQASVATDSTGVATSPPLVANGVAGRFTAVASVAGITQPLTFRLDNLAGKPPTVRAVGKRSLSGTVNRRYSRPLRVEVTDAAGRALQGQSVTFTLGAGAGGGAGGANDSNGGSPGASFSGGSSEVTETTNAAGIAVSPTFEANASAGRFTATAAVPGVTNPLAFSLDNLAGKPPRIAPLGPKRRAATVGGRYGGHLDVKLTDAAGKPLQGQAVTFTLGSGGSGGASGDAGAGAAGASFVGGSAQVTETSDAAGIATSPRFDANATAGRFTATATVGGSNASASFRLENLAAGAPTLEPQTRGFGAMVGARYGRPLAVRVLDGRRKPLQGQTVTFTLGESTGGGGGAGGSGSGGAGANFVGGSAQATATTDANGVAVSPRFEANTTAGLFTATATMPGTTAAASFRLDNRAAAPRTVTAGAGSSESAAVGTRFAIPLAVTVTDENGNPVGGAPVTFSAPDRGARGTFAGGRHRIRVRTNASGIAVAPRFTANEAAGGYVVEASVGGAVPAAFALVNRPAGG
jgi:adhesin/invasin